MSEIPTSTILDYHSAKTKPLFTKLQAFFVFFIGVLTAGFHGLVIQTSVVQVNMLNDLIAALQANPRAGGREVSAETIEYLRLAQSQHYTLLVQIVAQAMLAVGGMFIVRGAVLMLRDHPTAATRARLAVRNQFILLIVGWIALTMFSSTVGGLFNTATRHISVGYLDGWVVATIWTLVAAIGPCIVWKAILPHPGRW